MKEEHNLCDACKTCKNKTRSWVICLEECGYVIDALDRIESERATSEEAADMTREEAIAYGVDYYKDLISACCKVDEKHKNFVRMALEALKQEPCEDAISRKAVLDATVKKNSAWNAITNASGENLEEIINSLPSVTPTNKPKWIPIGERLPKVAQRVIFGMKNDEIYIGVLHALDNDLKITLEPTGMGYVYSLENVVAWMPLPEPYKESD